MTNGPYVYKSDFALNHQAKGRVLGRADALLDLLDARGIAVAAEDRARVLGCTDEATLVRWFHRAVTAASVEAVFVD